MADSNFFSNPTVLRARWFALPVVIGLFGAVLWRRRIQTDVVLAPVVEMSSPAPSVTVSIINPQAEPARVQSPLRWLLYLVTTVVCAGLLVALQIQSPQISSGIFVFIVLIAVGYGAIRGVQYIARQTDAIRNLLRYMWRLLQHHRDAVSFVGIAVATISAISSTLLFKDALNYLPLLDQALFWLVLTWLVLGVVIALKPQVVLPERWLASRETISSRAEPFKLASAFAGLMLTTSGIFLLFLLAEVNGNLLHSSLLQNVHHVVQFAFLALGVVLLVLGLGGRPHLPGMTKHELLCLLGVVLLALILRSVALDSVVRRYVDEVNFMDAVPRLWANPTTRILVPFSDTTAFTWIYPLLQSGISNIVGSGLPGLRLISSIFGTLGVVALYFLVRTLFHDKRLALMSALILATLPVHLHFSRIGLNNIADPFFGTLALAFLMRGLQSHIHSDYVIAGALLGLTQYFYEGGRLLFPPLVVLVFLIIWLKSGRNKVDLIHAGYALLVAILIAAPVYYTLIGGSNLLTPRLNEQSMGGSLWTRLLDSDLPLAEVLRGRFVDPFLTAISIPDQGWFYGGQDAFILLPFVPLFLLGVGYALWKIRTPGMMVFLLWAASTALGNSLLRENLWSPRYVVGFPALSLFLALGIYAAFFLIWPQSRPHRGRYMLIAALSILIVTVQTVYYFGDHAPNYIRQFQADEDWNDAFFRTLDLPPGTHAHFIMKVPVWDINMAAFTDYYRLKLKMDAIRPDELTPAYIKKITRNPTTNNVFFVNPYDAELLAHLRRYFVLSAPQISHDIPVRDQLGLYHILDDLQ